MSIILQAVSRTSGRSFLVKSHSSFRSPWRRQLCKTSTVIIGQHVNDALTNGLPVVALESTVITHGIQEQNLELARSLERAVQLSGAVPATVGIIKGQLIVGLSDEQIVYLARRELSQPIKVSRRNISIASALGLSGGTTCAGTMAIVCSMSDKSCYSGSNSSSKGSPIKVFATGGMGGVHRGGELSMDISADLYEFARSPIAVVSSGFKSFLDTRRSLEFLETMGCAVMSLPAEGDKNGAIFPGFYRQRNKEQVLSPWPLRGGLDEAAKIVFHNLESPLADRRASLLAVPIPSELSESELDNLDEALDSVREIDRRADLEGMLKTPLMLERLNRVTGALRANIELLKNNAGVGAQLALKYAHIANRSVRQLAELIAQNNPPRSGITFEGKPHLTLGGVGRNLATTIEYLGCKPEFITALANDNLGSFALAEFARNSNWGSRLHVNWWPPRGEDGGARCGGKDGQVSSSCFALVLVDSTDGQCEYVIANLDAAQAIDRRTLASRYGEVIRRAPLLVMDANLSCNTIEFLIEFCSQNQVPIFIEPTDVIVLARLVDSLAKLQKRQSLGSLLCLSPNLVELRRIIELFEGNDHDKTSSVAASSEGQSDDASLDHVETMARKLMLDHLPELRCLLVTMDQRGVLVAIRKSASDAVEDIERVKLMDWPTSYTKHSPSDLSIKHFPTPHKIESPISGSGAGDSFAGGFISGLLKNLELRKCLDIGFKAASLTLMDRDTISTKLESIKPTARNYDDAN